MHWSQTESSKWSLEILFNHPAHPRNREARTLKLGCTHGAGHSAQPNKAVYNTNKHLLKYDDTVYSCSDQ